MKRSHIEKDFEYKGFQCSVILQVMGHRCGYVNLESRDKSKYFNVDYDNIPIDIHGGLTYGQSTLVEHNDGYWIGWNYAHFNDGKDYPALFKYFKEDKEAMKMIGEMRDADSIFCSFVLGKTYSLDEVVEDCKSVVEQLIKLESEDNKDED